MAQIYENKKLGLNCEIDSTVFPYQSIGNIGNYKFYYRAENGSCEFRVCDDFGSSSNPIYIKTLEHGYIDTTAYVEKDLDFSKVPMMIEKCAEKFINYQKDNRHVYRYRYVAFVDIIGFKNIINDSVDKQGVLKDVLEALEQLQYEFIEHYNTRTQKAFRKMFAGSSSAYSDYDKYKTVAHQVSDCIIISNLAHKEGSLENIVQKCSLIAHMLIERGLFCRGYTQYGKVLHDEKHIVGPAYIEAYLAEEQEKNITIVLSKETYELHKRYPAVDKIEKRNFEKSLKVYTDEKYYIDYFNDYMFGNNVHVPHKDHYEKLRNKIEDEYKSVVVDKLRVKYEWMIEKFNDSEVVNDHILQPIQI